LTEALVNVEATLAHFRKLGAVSEDEAARLDAAARAMFFKERTYPAILKEAGLAEGERGKALKKLIKRCKVDAKREDALLLFAYLAYLEPQRVAPPADWRMAPTYTFALTLERARRFAGEEEKIGETIAA
jgi:hypothetical protein